MSLIVSEVRYLPAGADDAERGLLGYIACVVNGVLKLDGLTLRRTADRRLALSWPARTDRLGQRHAFVHPISDEARRDVEHQVFQQLGLAPEATP